MSLVLAMLTAAVFAVFGFPFSSYQFWHSWSRKGFFVGFACYLALAGAGGGFVGWLPAQLGILTSPTANGLINGVIFGVAGSLAVRADFGGRGPAGPAGAAGSAESRRAASLIGKGIDWTAAMLDQVARRNMENWAKKLSDTQLLEVTLDLVYGIGDASPAAIPGKTKQATIKAITEAMAAVGSEKPEQRAEARARLTQFCLHYLCARRAPQPIGNAVVAQGGEAGNAGQAGVGRPAG
ncbi:hypothetical protein AB0M36_14265 [Actinoplanes sp. NPDC051346]|uniref:hypothetical protein n=1 Tax=Actinoplanes sp. NPDC051346 TaxID=3155048 RepID=UPI00342DFC9F